MKGLALTIYCLSLTLACQGEERNYRPQSIDAAVGNEPEGEQVSVNFENTPAMQDNNVNINIGVTSKNGATKYQYALLDSEAAQRGSSSCAEAEYSEFVSLTETIARSGLAEGNYFICAKGKNAAGVTQQKPSTFAWIIDTSITTTPQDQQDKDMDEDMAKLEDEIPDVEEPPEVVLAPDPIVDEPEPPLPTPTPTPPADEPPATTPPADEPPATTPPAPTMAQLKIGYAERHRLNNMTINFTNGEKRKKTMHVYNRGTAPLEWRMQSDGNEAVDWLQAEYEGNTVTPLPSYTSNDKVFTGTVAPKAKSEAINFSLKFLDDTNKVANKYLQYGKYRHQESFIFYDDDNITDKELLVRLLIPRLSIRNSKPRMVEGKKKYWQLSLPKNKFNQVYKVFVNNQGMGNLSWQVLSKSGNKYSNIGNSWTNVSDKADWFLVRKNKGYIEIKLSNKAKNLKLTQQGSSTTGWDGKWNWIIFVSNGGKSYRTQKDKSAGKLYFKVCFEEKENEHKNTCK